MNKGLVFLGILMLPFSTILFASGLIQLRPGSTLVYADSPSHTQTQDQGTGNFIEDRLFKVLLDTYQRRDEQEFLKFYKFYLKSFPNTSRKAQLLEYRRKFFYSEALDVYKLGGALVDVRYPEAKSWAELKKMFRRFKQIGMKSVQVKMSQKAGEPVFLFEPAGGHPGYFFLNTSGPVLSDMLDRVSRLAHENEMKLFVSFSVRNLPSLDRLPILLIDQSYNSISSEVKFNGKLDLLHPKALDLLLNLTEALSKTNIDGLVLEDDFTLAPQEGFSEVARRRFKLDTGIDLDLSNLLVSYQSKGDFGVLGHEEYQVYLKWRSRQVRQLLWDLITETKKMRKVFLVGLEITPEMMSDNDQHSMYEYSTAFKFLWDLPVDFLILKWAKRGHQGESDPAVYEHALDRLVKRVDLSQTQIYLEVPLNHQTENVILLNDRIKKNLVWMREFRGLKQAIGPIDRRRHLDFLQHRVVEKLEVDEEP